MARFIVFVLIAVMMIVLVAGAVATRAYAATIATDAPVAQNVAAPSESADAPKEIMLGRFMFEPYSVRVGQNWSGGARFGTEMICVCGEKSTRFVGGLRFLIGGDGAAAYGTEGQLLLGIAQTISDRAAVAVVAPLGFSLGGAYGDYGPHGYAGVEMVTAVGRFDREKGPAVHGVELAAGISNRGSRARLGFVWPGKEIGLGLGVDWQREGDRDLFGVYVASVPGR